MTRTSAHLFHPLKVTHSPQDQNNTLCPDLEGPWHPLRAFEERHLLPRGQTHPPSEGPDSRASEETHGHHFPAQDLRELSSDAQNQRRGWPFPGHPGETAPVLSTHFQCGAALPLDKTRYIRALGGRGIGRCPPGTLEAPVLSERRAIENFSTDKG